MAIEFLTPDEFFKLDAPENYFSTPTRKVLRGDFIWCYDRDLNGRDLHVKDVDVRKDGVYLQVMDPFGEQRMEIVYRKDAEVFVRKVPVPGAVQ